MDRFTAMKIFVRIIQLGSFTAVAAEMGVSQSAVSKKIAGLETSLGATLLTRSNRQVILTEVGANYYEHCLSILNELEEAEAQTKEYTLNPKGHLRVNVPVSFGRLHVVPHLPKFMGLYKDISLDLNMLDRRIDILGEGFDVVIRIGQLADSNLVARKLGASPRVMVATADYLKRYGTPNKLGDLKQHNCLVYSNLASLNIWHFEHQGKGVSAQVGGSIISNTSDALLECVLAGLGIAVLPIWLIKEELDSGLLVTLMSDYLPTTFPINALYPQNNYIPLKVRCFVNFFKEVYLSDSVFGN